MHSSVEYVILNSELNRKQQVRTAPRLWPGAGTLKGKRVQIPHDLVTVIREFTARVQLYRSLERMFREGGGGC